MPGLDAGGEKPPAGGEGGAVAPSWGAEQGEEEEGRKQMAARQPLTPLVGPTTD